jgi:hypothetical protein
MRQISFNGFNLQTNTIQTQFVEDLTRVDYVNNNLKERAVSDGERIIERRYSARDLELQCNILGNTIDDVESKIDELKQALYGVLQGDLAISYGGVTRTYRATTSQFSPNSSYGYGLRRGFSLVFRLLDGFSTTAQQDILLENKAASVIEETIELEGSLAEQRPIISITVNSAVDLAVLSIVNATTNTELIIQRNFVDGDLIIIDTERYSVSVNTISNGIILLGIFPDFVSGENDMVITPTSTSHDLDIIFTYKPRFL